MKVYLKGIGFKDYRRTYSPVYDSKVYDKEAWKELLEDFNENVKVGTYNKLPYADWKILRLMDGDYKVVWFEIDNVYLAPIVVHIQEFKYLKDSDSFRMVGTDKKYDTFEAYSFGAYLADMLFYDYFDCVETAETPGRIDDYRLFGLDNLGAYDSEDNIGWRALNWALNPAVEGKTGKMIFENVKDNIKNLSYEFDKTTKILNDCYNIYKDSNKEWLNTVYKDVDRVKTSASDCTNVEVNPIRAITKDEAQQSVQDFLNSQISTEASTAVASTDWKYNTSISKTVPIVGGGVSDFSTIKISNDGSYGTATISIDDNLTHRIDTMEERINKLETNNDDMKGKGNNMKMFNFDFGPIKDNDAIRMSPYGLAVKNVNGTYQAYDKKNGEIMDVDVFNFKADNMFFKIPVGIDAIEAGDVIIFNRRPCFVFGFSEQGDVIAIDIAMGEKKTIMPTRSPFGFNFITKVMSLADNMFGDTPSADNPFGNMWMFAMMDDNSSMKDMLPMMMLMNGKVGSTMDPMMLYFMMKDGKGDDESMLPLLLMMNMKK
jgi:hypothetical protein